MKSLDKMRFAEFIEAIRSGQAWPRLLAQWAELASSPTSSISEFRRASYVLTRPRFLARAVERSRSTLKLGGDSVSREEL